MGLVNFRLLTSWWLALNYMSFTPHVRPPLKKKNTSRPLHSARCQWEKHLLPPIPHMRRRFRTPRFFKSFLITTNTLTCLFRDCLIYLFVYSISIFYETFNYVTLLPHDNSKIFSLRNFQNYFPSIFSSPIYVIIKPFIFCC